jgi:methionyl-tRNA formyltransferase
LPFSVDPQWTQLEYYQESFSLVAPQLAEILDGLAQGKISPVPQPADSPTPIARRFTKEDGFIAWSDITKVLPDIRFRNKPSNSASDTAPHSSYTLSEAVQLHPQTSQLLHEVMEQFHNWPQTILQAVRALSPWPGIWTIVPTVKGEKRLKILSASISTQGLLILDEVQLEGQTTSTWPQIQMAITWKNIEK